MTVVGASVLAAFGQGGIVATDLGSGAVLQAGVLSAPDPQTDCRTSCYNFFLARYRPTTSPRAEVAHLAATATLIGCPLHQCVVISRQQPSDLRNLAAVRNTPLVLGLVLALLAMPSSSLPRPGGGAGTARARAPGRVITDGSRSARRRGRLLGAE